MIPLDQEAQLETLSVVTALMAPYYAFVEQVVSWAAGEGIQRDKGAAYTSSMFEALSAIAGSTEDGDINAVCPNEVNTPMLRTGFAKRGFDPHNAIEQLNKTVPLGRIAEPEDIADVIAFLASDDARYIAGATLEVSGAKPVY